MHYSNGREAKVGDLVRGKGYNFRHEIIGILVAASPQYATCNCRVACFAVNPKSAPLARVTALPDASGRGWASVPNGHVGVEPTVEYGQLDAFVAIDPETGDVLPPEEAA